MTDWTTLTLVQPRLRREWELRRGDEAVALLSLSLFRSGAEARVGGRQLVIERQGRMRSESLVRDPVTGELLARLHSEGRRRLVEVGGRVAEWKRLGRKEGHGFVDSEGAPFLRARVKTGLTRTGGEVEIAPGIPEQDGLVLALLASYLLIRKAEEDASVAATTASVASSST